MSLLHRVAALVITVFLAAGLYGCGFSPLYGKKPNETGIKHLFARTEISTIPNREGVYLRNHLIDKFYIYGRPANPLYRLYVEPIKQTLTDLDITKTSDATRGQLRLDTKMSLKNTFNDEIVLRRDLTAITSYNILTSEFTNRVSERGAQEDALDDLARQIELHTSLYYDRIN
jgi:LPS-assembly lipoprotein